MASFGIYVPDGSELLEKIQKRAAEAHDNKVSAYARAVIERDLAGGTPDSMAPTVLVDLTRELLGPRGAVDAARGLAV